MTNSFDEDDERNLAAFLSDEDETSRRLWSVVIMLTAWFAAALFAIGILVTLVVVFGR